MLLPHGMVLVSLPSSFFATDLGCQEPSIGGVVSVFREQSVEQLLTGSLLPFHLSLVIISILMFDMTGLLAFNEPFPKQALLGRSSEFMAQIHSHHL